MKAFERAYSHSISTVSVERFLPTFSNATWFSQVYLGGEFVGGCDIMIDMHKSGELIEELNKVGIKSDLED